MPFLQLNSSAVRGIVSGVTAAFFWAAAFAGTRHGLNLGFSPADLVVHRYLWSGIAFFPLVIRAGLIDLNGMGWGRGLALAILGGPGFAIISYAGFLLVPLGHGGVIQPSCATLGGLAFARFLLGEKLPLTRMVGGLIIVCGLVVIGAESVIKIGLHGITGDCIFVLTGTMFAAFGTLVRLWRIAPFRATAVISVLSLLAVPSDWMTGGFDRMVALGWQENALQAVLQGVLAGPVALYLFVLSVNLLGPARAAVFPALVPPFVLFLGLVVLGEVPSPVQVAGLVIVLFGFRTAQRT